MLFCILLSLKSCYADTKTYMSLMQQQLLSPCYRPGTMGNQKLKTGALIRAFSVSIVILHPHMYSHFSSALKPGFVSACVGPSAP